MQVYFTLRRVIAQRSANLVHPRPKRLPPRAPDDEVRHLLAVPTPRLHPDVELQKGVGDGVVEGHVHGFEGLEKNAACRWQKEAGERMGGDPTVITSASRTTASVSGSARTILTLSGVT